MVQTAPLPATQQGALRAALDALAAQLGAPVLGYRVRGDQVEVVALEGAQRTGALPEPRGMSIAERAVLLPARVGQSGAQTVLEVFSGWLGVSVAVAASAPLRDASGQVIGAVSVLRAHAQRFAPQELALLEFTASIAARVLPAPRPDDAPAPVGALLDSVPLAVIEADGDGNLRSARGGALLGLQPQVEPELLRAGASLWALCADAPPLAGVFVQAYAGREVQTALTWRNRRFVAWARRGATSGVTGVLMRTGDENPAEPVVLPDVGAALQFVAGVGGVAQFTAAMESDPAGGGATRLVLRGRGLAVVVVRGTLEDVPEFQNT
jgi:hypothetical protein